MRTVLSLVVPHAAASASAARRAVVADLEDAGVPDEVLHDAALVVSELVGNAVRHGTALPGACIRVAWELRGHLVHLRVQDGGDRCGPLLASARAASSPHGPQLDAEGGRGLGIVGVVSDAWGVEPDRDGVVVWAELTRMALRARPA